VLDEPQRLIAHAVIVAAIHIFLGIHQAQRDVREVAHDVALAIRMRSRDGAVGVAHGHGDPGDGSLAGSAQQATHHAARAGLAVKASGFRIDAEADRSAVADEDDALAFGVLSNSLVSCSSLRTVRQPPAQVERWLYGWHTFTASLTGPPGHASLLHAVSRSIQFAMLA
jgi:hypothetical protein